jgi:glycolate oxidase iron-sulfur subunit
MATPATRAFDPHRPPDKELIEDCVHCGFCLPTCPTYALWGEEMDSPRGRIVLMNTGLKEGTEMSSSLVTHFDRCLGCMACVTACPSGVQYDRLIEATRPQVERNYRRPLHERAWRRLMFALFTHPGRLRAAVPLVAASKPLRRRAVTMLERWPRLQALQRLTPEVSLKATVARLPEHSAATGARRARVGLLQGCVQRVFFHRVNAATVDVLTAEGFEVFAPKEPRCCGALLMHSGEEETAKTLARKTIAAFEDCDVVAVNAAGCGSAMRDYAHLLDDDQLWADKAKAFSEKVKDVTQVLAAYEPLSRRHPVEMKVAYHDACHLAHAQGVRTEPRALLQSIPGVELIEPKEWEICCGSAGVYNLLQPQAGYDLGARKAANLIATGADAIAAGNPGCTLQLRAHLKEAGNPMPVYHPMELLSMSLHGFSQSSSSNNRGP